MRLFLLSLIGSLTLIQQSYAAELPTDASQKAKPATIKVLITKLADEATVEVKGKYRAYNPQNQLLIGSGSNKWDRFMATASCLKWGSEPFPGSTEIRLVPAPDSSLLVNNVPYKGCLEIYAIAGTINIVNEVDVENYLKDTLAAKCDESLNSEVLDALVIVERTHLTYLANKASYAHWHVAADKAGYTGHTAQQKAAISDAVERTRGMVLTYNNQLFPATWSRNSAGRTVSYASIFRKNVDSPAGVSKLPVSDDREETKWSASMPKQMLAELVGFSEIDQIDLYKADQSNKVYALRLSDGISSKDLDFFRLQEAIGPKIIRSNDFSVKVEDDSVLFTGYGDGAGTGLCLASADRLAKSQEDARKILLIHFPGVQLTKLRAGQDEASAYIWK